MKSNKAMKLTKLSPEAPGPGRRCRLVPALAGMDAGTASQLVASVGRTRWKGEGGNGSGYALAVLEGSVRVRLVAAADHDAWVAMRCALWPECPVAQHQQEVATLFRTGPSAMVAFVAEDGDRLLGFAEVSIRAWAEGCETDRVGYLEGWFVVDEARGRGIGKQLVATAEEWARAQGCTEFASDTDVDNELSAAAHRGLGFTEVGVVRCFRKRL